MKPPSLSDLPQARADINNLVSGAKSGRWKEVTMKVRYIYQGILLILNL